MKIKVNKVELVKSDVITRRQYVMDIPDEKIIDGITVKNLSYWYAIIDGRVFKSDISKKKMGGVFFSSKKDLDEAIANALYWRKKIIPGIGNGIGYDRDDFASKLKNSHKIEYKNIKF